jgi:hypothetical protein
MVICITMTMAGACPNRLRRRGGTELISQTATKPFGLAFASLLFFEALDFGSNADAHWSAIQKWNAIGRLRLWCATCRNKFQSWP